MARQIFSNLFPSLSKNLWLDSLIKIKEENALAWVKTFTHIHFMNEARESIKNNIETIL